MVRRQRNAESLIAMLYTRCTHCETVFELTLEEVNRAGGAVRCGVCQTTFDAKRHLRDEPFPAPAAPTEAMTDDAPSPGASAEDEQSTASPCGSDLTSPADEASRNAQVASGVPATEVEALRAAPTAPPATPGPNLSTSTGPAAVGIEEADHEQAVSAERMATVFEEAVGAYAAQHPPANAPPGLDEPDHGDAAVPGESGESAQTAPRRAPASAQENQTADEDLAPLLHETPARRSAAASLLWGLAAVVLTGLLGVQAIAHWHDRLVQVPHISDALVAVNAYLGNPLYLDYDPARYEFVERPRVRLLTPPSGGVADDDPPSTADRNTPAERRGTPVIAVVATIANTAPVAQPYPALQLVIEDRWGRPVGARTLMPEDYAEPTTARELLAPDERFEVDVQLVAGDAALDSFALEICLPRESGKLNCAAR
jgi:predicted Zn finger-like uncharacterized protein